MKKILNFGKSKAFDNFCIITYTENTGRWNQEGNPQYSDKKLLVMSKQKNRELFIKLSD